MFSKKVVLICTFINTLCRWLSHHRLPRITSSIFKHPYQFDWLKMDLRFLTHLSLGTEIGACHAHKTHTLVTFDEYVLFLLPSPLPSSRGYGNAVCAPHLFPSAHLGFSCGWDRRFPCMVQGTELGTLLVSLLVYLGAFFP